MEPREFYNTAEELLKSFNRFSNKEGISRTIVSRYYYYLYLEIREIIVSIDKTMEKELKGESVIDAHKKVRNYLRDIYYTAKRELSKYEFQQYEVESIRTLKNALSNLFKMRKEADYELDLQINREKAKEAKTRVDSVSDAIENFRGFLER